MNKFSCVILSHGRPDNVKTYNSLRRQGYTGDIFIFIDNTDKTSEKYFEKYGSEVVQFDKTKDFDFDQMDNFGDRKVILYARNESQRIMKEKGYKYILQLDDDYTSFDFRKPVWGSLLATRPTRLDEVFPIFVDFIKTTKIKTISFAQSGDFIGGAGNDFFKKGLKTKRKAMNSFFIDLDNPIEFRGRVNEDVNAYVLGGMRGDIFLTVPQVSITQSITQSSKGGMTDEYTQSGTYIKSFYTVMASPSSVTIREMGDLYNRLHHHVSWDKTAVKIIREDVKK